MVNNLQYLSGLGFSDHVCLRFDLTCYSKSSTYCKSYYDLRFANFIRMRQLLEQIDWHTNLYPLNTLKAWEVLASHFELCLGECVPYKTSSSKKQNMFMSQQALHLKNRKKTLVKIHFF